jgi:CRP-like cAMP-binding protein
VLVSSQDTDLAARLAAVPLFSQLDEAALGDMCELVSPFDVGPGYVLVQPGLVGSGLFLIEEGTVTLTVQDREVELGPGEFFGELALLDDRAVRTTRVRAKTAVRGCCIDRDHFAKLLEAEPTIALTMLKVLAHRLVDLIASH